MQEIDPFKALDFIKENAKAYAQAKANVIYMNEYRKSLKAKLEAECTEKTETAKERYAYAHPTYINHLQAIREAVGEAERLRWLMVSAEAQIEMWRSLEASQRAESRVVQ
jgi:hypothetical protein